MFTAKGNYTLVTTRITKMAFELKSVVPWGRNMGEYKIMFDLSNDDLNHKIISFGDGPASFNYEMTKLGKSVTSLDPIYQFVKDEIQQRIAETKDTILEQIHNNRDKFLWTTIKSIPDLEHIRMEAMNAFIEDFELGKVQGRYVCHELPMVTEFKDLSFDLGLSSHFLILYAGLGLDFHLKSISEMLRICKEIRIFPLLNLNGHESEVLKEIIAYFESDFEINIHKVDYEFQKGGNRLLKITRRVK
ncbi:hypothetical protein [Flavobacterium sedimenticola]|uniref:SAM-dependent methyltransferase n=1 Tax=Flavobacterium sedimenticola TaxID=3043286 RepID=A0ABT6XS32_9FLAO|nr:hypothetical protein [Flavobacterium sedimenticola]MDI9257907.1 hypothetical protein [Flavobacterium sedimenticola]